MTEKNVVGENSIDMYMSSWQYWFMEKKSARLIALIEPSLMKRIQTKAKQQKVSVAEIVRRKLSQK